jgi:DNA-binding response OmpR family regulator
MDTLLIADDDQQILDLYQMKFTKAGFGVVMVSEADKVLEQAKAVKPAAILLDHRLGEGDGMEIFKQIRATEQTKNIPVLLLSNQDATAEELETIKTLGNAEYIIKEKIDLNDLVSKIKKLPLAR